MTGERFVYSMTRLHGFNHADASQLSKTALEQVGMSTMSSKVLREMSRGMRQRIKIAQAIAPRPRILLLDEPLTGTDPVGRADLISLFKDLGKAGACVLVSSHVLHEVEAMTDDVVFIRFGRLRARGNVFELRTLLTERPYRLVIEVGDPRALAAALARDNVIRDLRFGAKESWK